MFKEHTIKILGKQYPINMPVVELIGSPVSIRNFQDESQKLKHRIAEKDKELINCYNVEAKLTAQIIELRMKLQEINKISKENRTWASIKTL